MFTGLQAGWYCMLLYWFEGIKFGMYTQFALSLILRHCFHLPDELAHFSVFNVDETTPCHPTVFTTGKIIDPIVKLFLFNKSGRVVYAYLTVSSQMASI